VARVELRPSGQYVYAVVVEDLQENGLWRKKVIGSFGNAADQNNVNRAHMMANAVNAGKSLLAAKLDASEDDLMATFAAFGLAAVAGLAIAWLMSQR
jgi:hypothetical protein